MSRCLCLCPYTSSLLFSLCHTFSLPAVPLVVVVLSPLPSHCALPWPGFFVHFLCLLALSQYAPFHVAALCISSSPIVALSLLRISSGLSLPCVSHYPPRCTSLCLSFSVTLIRVPIFLLLEHFKANMTCLRLFSILPGSFRQQCNLKPCTLCPTLTLTDSVGNAAYLGTYATSITSPGEYVRSDGRFTLTHNADVSGWVLRRSGQQEISAFLSLAPADNVPEYSPAYVSNAMWEVASAGGFRGRSSLAVTCVGCEGEDADGRSYFLPPGGPVCAQVSQSVRVGTRALWLWSVGVRDESVPFVETAEEKTKQLRKRGRASRS